jgi:hypothetical protein
MATVKRAMASKGVYLSFNSNHYTTDYEILGRDGQTEGDARDFGKYVAPVTTWQIKDDEVVMSGKLLKDIHIKHAGMMHMYKKDSPVLLYVDDDETKGYINEAAGAAMEGGARSSHTRKHKTRRSRNRSRRVRFCVRYSRRR